MDDVDQQWVNGFIGDGSSAAIAEGSIIQGFLSIISWIDPEGNHRWRSYNTIDAPLSNILGLLEMTKYVMLTDNTRPLDESE